MEKTKARVLIVDNEKTVVDHVIAILKHVVGDRAELQCVTAGSGKECLELLASETFDLIILDLKMEPLSGAEVIACVDQEYRSKIVVLSDYLEDHREDQRSSWMARGVIDLWPKPITETRAKAVLQRLGVIPSLRVLSRKQLDDAGLQNIIGQSDAIRNVLTSVLRIANANSNILIRGKSGTGKELIARAIHSLSPRRADPFIALNCSAIPGDLLESELFGHERGAFTGAYEVQAGLLEVANGGTLLLDEIGDMPLALQTKLLRVLEERELRHIGGRQVISFDVRIISATNQDLERAMSEGGFREDLYYRLKGIEISMPSLKERGGDIDDLVVHFISAASNTFQRSNLRLTHGAQALLRAHSWPGNIRELAHICESLVAGGDENGEITGMDVRRLLPDLTLLNGAGPSGSSPDDLSRASKSEGYNGAKHSEIKSLEERVPRRPIGQLEVDELVVAVIVFGCNYTALADHLGLSAARPDQTIGSALRKREVFETIANRFRTAHLSLASMAETCMVKEGELQEALRSDKFCKAVDRHLNFKDHFREMGQAGEMAIREFVNKIGTRYMRALATSVGIGIHRRSRKNDATN